MTTPTANIAGHTFDLATITERDQVELDVLLLGLAGPALAVGARVGMETALGELSDIARTVQEPGEAFDLGVTLERLGNLDTADPRLEAAWVKLLAALPRAGADAVAEGVPQFTDRLTKAKADRLFELAVLGRVCVRVDGEPRRIAKWGDLTAVTGGRPWVKYALLWAQLRHTYGPAVADAFVGLLGLRGGA